MSFGTAKHRLFAQYLADGLSQTEAYIKAGFSAKSASANAATLLKRNKSILVWRDEFIAAKAKVAAEGQKAAIAQTGLSLASLIDDLVKIKEMGMTAIPVLDNKGNETGEYRADLGNAVKAITLLGQQQFGAFIAKSQSVPADPRDLMTDEEVRALKAELAAKKEQASDAVGRRLEPGKARRDGRVPPGPNRLQ